MTDFITNDPCRHATCSGSRLLILLLALSLIGMRPDALAADQPDALRTHTTMDLTDLVQYGRLRQVHTRRYSAEDTLAAAKYTYSNVASNIGAAGRVVIEEDGTVLALGLFGLGRRAVNARSVLSGEVLSDEEISRSARRTYEQMSMTLEQLVEANELDTPQRLALSFAAPILLSINQVELRNRVVDQGFSATMGYFGGYRPYGYSYYEIEHFRNLIQQELSAQEQAALFSQPVATLLPPPIPLRDDLFYKDLLLTPDELNKTLYGPLDDARVTPEFAAFIRTREQLLGKIYRELKEYGDELLDDYIYAIFTYSDHSGPHIYSLHYGTSMEGIFQRGQGASYMLWEPITNTPFRGFGRDELDRPRELFLEEEVTGGVGYWNPYLDSAAYGRMSNTSIYKYMAAACDPGLMVATLSPGCFAFRPIHELIQNGDVSGAKNFLMMHMAETWANRLGFRMDTSHHGDQHRFDAARQMNGFQARHEDLFVGARPYDRVAVWASMQQHWINRYDTSLGTSRMLTDANIEHRVVIDPDITDNRLDGINCLIISNIRLVTDEQLAVLNAFAKRDGNGIVVLGRFGDRDEWDRDRADALELLGDGVPEGRIVHLDENVYPQLGHNGEYRIRGAGDDLAPLVQAVRQIHGDAFTYLATTPELIELHPLMIDKPGGVENTRRVVMHALNYDIDPWTGAASKSEPLAVRVLLPGDATQITQVLYYEPSQGSLDQEGTVLDVELEQVHGKTYASLTIPGFHLNSVVVVDYVTP